MTDKQYLDKAVDLAFKASKKGDFPVGCIIVKDNKIIAKAYNKKENKGNAVMHAELLAISKACKRLNTWHLEDCTLYTSLEPCVMCAGAIIQSRIKKIVYASNNQNFGVISNGYNHLSKINVIQIENKRNLQLIKQFFIDKRN